MGKNIDRLPNGKYRARYSIPNGKRISKTFDRQQEAKIWLNEQTQQFEKHGSTCESSKMYFCKFYKDIFEPNYLKNRGLKATTISDYNYYYKRLSSDIENVQLCDIDDLFIEKLIDKYSASVQNHILSILKVILDVAVKERLIEYNPARNKLIKKKSSKKKKKKIALTEEETTLLSNELIKNETDNIADFAILLAIATGMRFGELAALEWKDIDYCNKNISINKNLQYDILTREPIVQAPKTESGERNIPIANDDIFLILNKIKKRDAKDSKFKDFVFIRKNGLPLTDKACNERLEDVCKKIGIDRITIHDLRHTFATRCAENGLDLPSTQKILGHSKSSMTLDIYTHVSEKKKATEMAKLNSIFG